MALQNGAAKDQRENAVLAQMALSQAWPITPEMRGRLLDDQLAIVSDPFAPSFVRTLAAKNVIKMNDQNLKAVAVAAACTAQTAAQPAAPQVVNTNDDARELVSYALERLGVTTAGARQNGHGQVN